MRQHVISLSLLLMMVTSFSACKKWHQEPGNRNTESRNLNHFSEVEVDGSMDVIIHQASTPSVEISAGQNELKYIETDVVNNTLRIRRKHNTWMVKSPAVYINVYTPDVEKLVLNGSGRMVLKQRTSMPVLYVEATGSGHIECQTNKADEVWYLVSGSGHIEAKNLQSEKAVAQVTGSGNIKLYVKKDLHATVSGSGSILYWGNPTQVFQNITGSGTIQGQN